MKERGPTYYVYFPCNPGKALGWMFRLKVEDDVQSCFVAATLAHLVEVSITFLRMTIYSCFILC